MAKIKKIYIDDIAKLTQAMLERASKKHKSIIAYCIFVEGEHFYALTPEYNAFAQFVVPPARYLKRNAEKAAKQKQA